MLLCKLSDGNEIHDDIGRNLIFLLENIAIFADIGKFCRHVLVEERKIR